MASYPAAYWRSRPGDRSYSVFIRIIHSRTYAATATRYGRRGILARRALAVATGRSLLQCVYTDYILGLTPQQQRVTVGRGSCPAAHYCRSRPGDRSYSLFIRIIHSRTYAATAARYGRRGILPRRASLAVATGDRSYSLFIQIIHSRTYAATAARYGRLGILPRRVLAVAIGRSLLQCVCGVGLGTKPRCHTLLAINRLSPLISCLECRAITSIPPAMAIPWSLATDSNTTI